MALVRKCIPRQPPPGKGKPPSRVALEPRIATLLRQIARQERMQLSPLVEQALVAWIRRWRPRDYRLEITGEEAPKRR